MSWNRENCTNYTSNGTKQDPIKTSQAEKVHQFQQCYAYWSYIPEETCMKILLRIGSSLKICTVEYAVKMPLL